MCRAKGIPSVSAELPRTPIAGAQISPAVDFDVGKPRVSVESSGGAIYRVVVTQGRATTTHEVTVTPEDVARYAPGVTPERLLEASFEFLLEREPASSILSRFALPVIERYFPEYPVIIRQMV